MPESLVGFPESKTIEHTAFMAQNEWWKQGTSPVEDSAGGDWLSKGATPVAEPKRTRGLLEAANDLVIEGANAAAGGVASLASFVRPGNKVSSFIDENIIKAGEAKQSDVARGAKQALSSGIQNADGMLGELGAVGKYVVENPGLATAQALGSFALPGGFVKGAGKAAQVMGAGAKGIETAGRVGGIGAGAAMAGGDAAGSAYDLATQAGATDEQGVAAGRQASVIPALVGGVTGAFGAEKLLAGGQGFKGGLVSRALKTGASEAGQEAIEEGVTQYEGQRAAMPYDASIDPIKGVAGAAGMGAALGGITGAGISAVTGNADAPQARQTVPEPAPIQPEQPEAVTPVSDVAGTSTVVVDGQTSTKVNRKDGSVEIDGVQVVPPTVKPSEAMGIDPSAGAISKVAAMAVDTGVTQQAQAEQIAAQVQDAVIKGEKAQPQAQPVADQADPFANVAATPPPAQPEPVPMESRSLDELRQGLRNAQDPAIRKTIAAEIRKRREAMPDPLSQKQENPLEPQATKPVEASPQEQKAPPAATEVLGPPAQDQESPSTELGRQKWAPAFESGIKPDSRFAGMSPDQITQATSDRFAQGQVAWSVNDANDQVIRRGSNVTFTKDGKRVPGVFGGVGAGGAFVINDNKTTFVDPDDVQKDLSDGPKERPNSPHLVLPYVESFMDEGPAKEAIKKQILDAINKGRTPQEIGLSFAADDGEIVAILDGQAVFYFGGEATKIAMSTGAITNQLIKFAMTGKGRGQVLMSANKKTTKGLPNASRATDGLRGATGASTGASTGAGTDNTDSGMGSAMGVESRTGRNDDTATAQPDARGADSGGDAIATKGADALKSATNSATKTAPNKAPKDEPAKATPQAKERSEVLRDDAPAGKAATTSNSVIAAQDGGAVGPAQAVDRPDNWRGNAIKAGKVARSLGLDPKGKRLKAIVAEIDAKDGESVAKGPMLPATSKANEINDVLPESVELSTKGAQPKNVQNTPQGTAGKAAPVEAAAPKGGDAAKAAGVPDAGDQAGVRADGVKQERFPSVRVITGLSMGPGGRVTPKPIADGKPLYRETSIGGLDDLLRMDSQADVVPMFVADNPDLAIGQGVNKGVRVTFRPDSLSGRENKKPGTGDIAGREYQTDIVAPRAVQSITMPASSIKSLRMLTRRSLLSEFDRTDSTDGTVTFNRKGLPADLSKNQPISDTSPERAQKSAESEQVAKPEQDGGDAKAEKKPSEKIEDFGEKIGGAKKDLWTSFKDGLEAVSDDDIAGQPLSKVWPAPDYQALIDSGTSPEVVAFIRAARDEIPSKPRVGYKVKGWAGKVKVLRGLALDMMAGKVAMNDVQAQLEKAGALSRSMQGFMGRVDLYQAVGHAKSLEGIGMSWNNYTLYRGQKDVSMWVVEQDAKATAWGNFPRELATGKTKDEAIDGFKKAYGKLDSDKEAKKGVQFEIISFRGEAGYWIAKKLGRNHIKIHGPIETVQQAREYRDNNQSALVAKLEKIKEIPNERRDTNEPRVGEDMRNGADVTPEMFAQTFGFRGVEFGNWVEQGRRQRDLNDAFDSLMDMAAVLGIPPKAISLDGQLGLAFGARGTGGSGMVAAAHYEPEKVVINLTKKNGAGSLGHEWWHAVDNHISKRRKQSNSSFMTTARDVLLAARDGGYMPYEGVRPELVKAFGNVVKSINMTSMKKRSSVLDGKRAKEYWTTGEELSARSFEAYLISKLQDQNASNDYLANIVREEVWEAAAALGLENENSYPYPTQKELPGIRAAFDELFQTIQTRETDTGNVEMYFGTKPQQAQGTPADRAVMAMAGDGKSADEILNFIASASKSPYRRMLAKKLIASGANPAVSIGGAMGGGEGFRFLAKYSRKDHEVTLSEGASDRAEQIFLHETVHAATLMALDKGGLMATQMKRLFQAVDADGGAAGQYGLKNVGEFVAEAFTNPEFQKALKGIKVPGGTVWERFVNMVRRVLGLADTQQDALSKALELGAEVMRENTAMRKAKSFRAEDGPAFAGGKNTLTADELESALDAITGNDLEDDQVFSKKYPEADDDSLTYVKKLGASAVGNGGYHVSVKGDGVREAGPHEFFFYNNDDEFIGLARLTKNKDQASINMIAFTEDARGSGFGKAFYKYLLDDLGVNVKSDKEITEGTAAMYKSLANDYATSVDKDGRVVISSGAFMGTKDQTETEAFKKWFGDSVVTENGKAGGKPLVVYHGTRRGGFTQFAVNAGSRSDGFVFTSNKGMALTYSGQDNQAEPGPRSTKAGIYSAFMSLKNPKTIDWGGEYFHKKDGTHTNDAIAKAMKEGFDGLIVKNVNDPGGYALMMQNRGSVPEGSDVAGDLYIAFNPEQIKSATGNNQNFDPSDPDISHFGVADAVQQIKQFDVKSAPKNTWAHYRGMAMQALGRRQIVDLYSEELPQLGEYDYLVQKMDAEKNDSGAEADEVARKWAGLNERAMVGTGKLAAAIGPEKYPGMDKKLADLMHDATLAQLDPDKPMPADAVKAQYDRLKTQFDALSPNAQALFRQARDMYADHYTAVQKAIKERIERSEMSAGQKRQIMAQMDEKLFQQLKGVYFPLARFGQYVIVVKDANGEVKNVTRAESVNEAEESRKALMKAFPAHMGNTVGKVLKQAEFNAGRDAVGKGFMADLMGALDKNGVNDELRDTVAQLYLSSLPDLSWAKHGIHRKGTPGFSQDARRAFAQNMFHGARYLAKLRYADQLQDQLIEMQDHVKVYEGVDEYDSIEAQQVVDEMVKRHDLMMNPNTSPVSTALTSFGFLFHMGLSPASAMVNLTQTALVAFPQMGAKWGFTKASAALLKASEETVRAKNDLLNTLKGEEREALDRAIKDGTIDVTMAHDLAGISQGEDQRVMWKLRPVMRAASFMFHHAEKFNRQATFLAAYRLAKEASPEKNFEQIYEEAKRTTYDGHFDYSACVDDETEILTASGWKRRSDLVAGDVAIATDENGKAVESRVLAVNVYKGDKEVIEFKSSRKFGMVLTPNHDAIVQNYSSRDQKWQKIRKVRADELKNHHFIVRAPLQEIEREGTEYGEDMAALLGWIAAEGWYSKYRKTTQATDVRIAQSDTHNPEYVQELRGILTRLGGEFKEYTYKRKLDTLTTFVLRRSLGRKIQEAMPSKVFTADMVARMNSAEMKACVMAFIKGDGTKRTDGGKWAVAQKNGANLDHFQAMATMLGMRCTLSQSTKNDMVCAEVDVEDDGCRTHVRPMQRTSKTVPLIWCPTTEHGTWVARRNGAVFVTGNSNRPRFMQGNWQKVILLFKSFAQNSVYVLARNAHQSIKAMDPKDRSRARKTLAGILATHAAAAGVLGLPIVNQILTIASWIGGDDDEPWDAEVAMQNAMAEMLGKDAAEVMAKGLSRLTPFDISGRVSLNNLILPDVYEGLEGKAWAESAMSAALGPVAGIGVNVARGMQKITDGDYMRGMEDMMPSALRGPMKAFRYANEGAVDKSGIVITDEVRAAGIAGQALGLSPSQVRRDTERRSAIYGVDKALTERRSVLMRMFADARMNGDTETVQEIQSQIQNFNTKNPGRKITGQNLVQSIKNRRKRIEQAQNGIYLPKNRRDAIDAVDF